MSESSQSSQDSSTGGDGAQASSSNRTPFSQVQVKLDIDDLILPDIYLPFLRLSPPPSMQDYHFNLTDDEGIFDLFLWEKLLAMNELLVQLQITVIFFHVQVMHFFLETKSRAC